MESNQDPPSYLIGMINDWTGDEFFQSQNGKEKAKTIESIDYDVMVSDDMIDDAGYQYKKSIKYGSEEARHLSREYVIEESCKNSIPRESKILAEEHYQRIIAKIIPQVIKASIELKLQADNPIKLFVYMFMVQTSMQSKQVLQLFKLAQTKTGNQFSVISKGRQIYQRYMNRTNTIIPDDIDIHFDQDDLLGKKHVIVDELARFHKETGLLTGQTRDVLSNIAAVCVQGVEPKNKKIRDIIIFIQNYINKDTSGALPVLQSYLKSRSFLLPGNVPCCCE